MKKLLMCAAAAYAVVLYDGVFMIQVILILAAATWPQKDSK